MGRTMLHSERRNTPSKGIFFC